MTSDAQVHEACRLALLGQHVHSIALATNMTYDQVRNNVYKRGIRVRDYRTCSTPLAKHIVYQSKDIRRRSYAALKIKLLALKRKGK